LRTGIRLPYKYINVAYNSCKRGKNAIQYLCCANITDLQLVLNIGYADVANVPQDLIEVAYEMIDIMYYNKEGKLSNLAKMTLDGYKRFII